MAALFRIALCAPLLLASACVGKSQPPVATSHSAPRQPEITRPEVVTDTGMDESWEPPPIETATPAQVQAIAPNPAASSLVAKGVDSFNANDLSSAEWNLEEAIRLAPNYGPAYYWMARVKLEANAVGDAQNFLNKAESLAPIDSAWYQRVQQLKREMLGGIRD